MTESRAQTVPERWYQDSFGEDYLRLYRRRDAQLARAEAAGACRALGLQAGARVLDLACGGGRHGPPLREAGLAVVGLDLSVALLDHARRREAPGRMPLVRGDMRRLPFGPAFHAVLSFFTSFGYFFEEVDNRAVLAEIARVLAPGGRFLLDLMDPAVVRAQLAPRTERREGDWRVVEDRWISAGDSSVGSKVTAARVEKHVVVTEPGGATRTFHESVRLYSPEEATAALASVGLVVTGRLGDFDGSVHVLGVGPRMILVGHQKGRA